MLVNITNVRTATYLTLNGWSISFNTNTSTMYEHFDNLKTEKKFLYIINKKPVYVNYDVDRFNIC